MTTEAGEACLGKIRVLPLKELFFLRLFSDIFSLSSQGEYGFNPFSLKNIAPMGFVIVANSSPPVRGRTDSIVIFK